VLVFLVGAVQFVNILDFMIVMPMGPDLAPVLAFDEAQIGLVGAAYTAAAAVSGVIGALFLDRFDRRKALAVSMIGLVLGTAAAGFAWDLPSLLAARVIAGTFGGPASSIALSIIADAVPPERRGKALGAVMGAFAAASVLGVPAGLELARIHWRMPFFGVAALGVVVAFLAILAMPPMRAHLDGRAPQRGPSHFFRDLSALVGEPASIASLAAMAVLTFSVFSVVPNISAYVQHNLHYPREHLGLLYLAGGVVSFFAMRLFGALVDRLGSPSVALGGTIVFAITLVVGFIRPVAALPVVVLFILFMVAGSARGVPYQALASRVPPPHQRASFMSAQSAVQHLASAIGAFVAAQILVTRPDHSLVHMPEVAMMSLCASLALPPLLWFVDTRVRRREAVQVP
jgi:predicted MFS family arabinose efflux permease